MDIQQKIRGCFVGGAVGDALGYAVEFMQYSDIVRRYGSQGITAYALPSSSEKACISDDTQMTLFTAEGLLQPTGDAVENLYRAYKNWYVTQTRMFGTAAYCGESELMRCPELFAARAPGNTCLSALSSGKMGTVKAPLNSSKGCGGVMRVAPVACVRSLSDFERDQLAADAAAITHGHPLGWLPAALLVHILHRLLFERDAKEDLMTVVTQSTDEFAAHYSSVPHADELIQLMRRAVHLSQNDKRDVENITALGEGWVAEETLAIAVYCALRHSNDFSEAIIAAVNHNGDSDSTGAVAGNLLGAYVGIDGIDDSWKNNLELFDLILSYADRFVS